MINNFPDIAIDKTDNKYEETKLNKTVLITGGNKGIGLEGVQT